MKNKYAYTLATAARFYPFLTKHDWIREDINQIALLCEWLNANRAQINRELYRLARDLGWRKVNLPGSWNKKTWRKLP